MGWAQWVNVAGSGLVALAALVCVITYALLAPWRASEAGRHVMAMTAAMGGLGVYTVLITVWPDGTPAAVLRVSRAVMILALAGLLVQRTMMVIRTQLGNRKHR
jgi:hypothetical protein